MSHVAFGVSDIETTVQRIQNYGGKKITDIYTIGNKKCCFCEAIYDTQKQVEDVTCYLAHDYNEAKQFLMENKVTLLIDPEAKAIDYSSQRLLLMPFLLKRI